MLAKSYAAFLEELQRCETLGIRLYNIHPGHTNSCGEVSTPEECMDRIAGCINRAHAQTSGVTVVLENVAGQVRRIGGACSMGPIMKYAPDGLYRSGCTLSRALCNCVRASELHTCQRCSCGRCAPRAVRLAGCRSAWKDNWTKLCSQRAIMSALTPGKTHMSRSNSVED